MQIHHYFFQETSAIEKLFYNHEVSTIWSQIRQTSHTNQIKTKIKNISSQLIYRIAIQRKAGP